MYLVWPLLLLLAGCTVLREPYERPQVAAPGSWSAPAAGVTAGAWPDPEWWKVFRSEELDGLVAEAQSGSFDLKAAAARVAQAKANARIAAAPLYPTLTLGVQADRAKTQAGSGTTIYTLAPRVTYELDMWGLNRFGAEAADAALLATVFGQDVVRLTLTADVASSYFQILSLNDRIAAARSSLDNSRRVLRLFEAQRGAGKISRLEVERQFTQVAGLEAAIPPLIQARKVAYDNLCVLLGRAPDSVPMPTRSLRGIGAPEVPIGVPSELAERRPDIKRAEADLISASADISAARAALFPAVQLSARGGVASSSLGRLFDGPTGFYTLGLGLLATIFDGGALSGQVDLARGRQAELAQVYGQTVVSAFREVEDALAGIEQFELEEDALQQAAVHAREAFRLAEIRYREGAGDYLTVLDAERALIFAENAVDPPRLSRFISYVDLYRALGGGWQGAPATAEAAAPGVSTR
jgi:NodT family efflux transporter outer membrane factor (OMF) lipoprotein